jgi:HAD superfamily hydrolase (TIGR01509 family)
MRYKYIIFDIGGTLLRWGEASLFARFLAAHAPQSCPDELVADAQDLQRMMIEAFHRNRHHAVGMGAEEKDFEAFWRQVLDDTLRQWKHPRYGGELLEPFTRAVLEGHFDVPFDDARDTLQRLRDKGFRLGVISNWSQHLPDELERLGLAPYFDFVIVSSLVGVAKPSPEIFRLGLAKAGCQAHEALYVGDNISDDCEGARRAGLDVALIDHRGSYTADPVPCSAVFPDLATLASKLVSEEDLP